MNRKRRSGQMSMQDALQQWRDRLEPELAMSGDQPESATCDTCNGAGWVLPHSGALMSSAYVCPAGCQFAQGFIAYRRDARFRRAGIPKQYQTLSFATFEALPPAAKLGKLMGYAALLEFIEPDNEFRVSRHNLAWRLHALMGDATPDRIDQWLHEPDDIRQGVALQGPAGIGKTGLTIAAMNVLLDRGVDVRYMRVYGVIAELRSTWKDGTELETLQDFQQCPILVLDEFNLIDAEAKALPHQAEYMTQIIRYRAAAELPTLITCNINRDQFYDQWGVQCADVVMALCQWVVMGGTKLRQTDSNLGEAL
jgi:hypothetical protein